MSSSRTLSARSAALCFHSLLSAAIAGATSPVYEKPQDIAAKASLIVKADLTSRRPLTFSYKGESKLCGYLYEANSAEWIKGSGSPKISFSSIQKVEFVPGESFLIVGFRNPHLVAEHMDAFGKEHQEAALSTLCLDQASDNRVETMPLTMTKFEQSHDGIPWLVFDLDGWLGIENGWGRRTEKRDGKTVTLIRWSDVLNSMREWLLSDSP